MTLSKEKRRKIATEEKVQDQKTDAHPQVSCHLLRLPGELRNEIYKCLFSLTRLTFGERCTIDGLTKVMKPAPNSLAVLRTCRQVNQEAGALWLRQVLFSFENIDAMMDKLSPLPATILSQIRHLRIRGYPLVLTPLGADDHILMAYCLVWAIKLLPALRLDRLTVLGRFIGEDAYNTLEGLIMNGNGWRELHFITPNSRMLGFAKVTEQFAEEYQRKPQPATWNRMLTRRDGVRSKPSVVIYRSTQSDGPPRTVMKPRLRQIFEQNISSLEDLDSFGEEADEQLLAENEKGKELLVVVKRGVGADIAEEDRPPYSLHSDIRQWALGMTWEEIRHQCIDIVGRDEDEDAFEDDDSFDDDDAIFEDQQVEADHYEEVDEYQWIKEYDSAEDFDDG